MARKRKLRLIYIPLILTLIACVGSIYAYFEAHSIKLAQYVFVSEDVPDSFVNKKLVFISDIHCDKYFTREDVRKLVQRINVLEPDIILMGGDYVSTSRDVDSLFSEIGNLKSKYGVYAVLGNHDHWTSPEFIRQGLRDCGFMICDNQSYWVKVGTDSIKIGGVGDLWSDELIINNTLHDVNKKDFCLLLSHQPDYVEQLNTDCIDLMLSGHTHGGQITFFGLWAPIMPGATRKDLVTTKQEYRYGWMEKNGIKFYVSSGIGMGGLPFRFFARPEIVEITLKKK